MPKEKPGKGKKLCPACKQVCGATTKVCPNDQCKHEFVSKASKQEALIAANHKGKMIVPNEYRSFTIHSIVNAPAGYCPVKLKQSPTDSDIVDWADKVRFHFLDTRKKWLNNGALCYFLKHDFDVFSKEYRDICKVVNRLPDITYEESPQVPHG